MFLDSSVGGEESSRCRRQRKGDRRSAAVGDTERRMPRRFPGTANGSMTVNHDVVGSSPTGGAKTALAFADAFSFLG